MIFLMVLSILVLVVLFGMFGTFTLGAFEGLENALEKAKNYHGKLRRKIWFRGGALAGGLVLAALASLTGAITILIKLLTELL